MQPLRRSIMVRARSKSFCPRTGAPSWSALLGPKGLNDQTWRDGKNRRLTAIIEREDEGYAAPCPEIGIASQGVTVDEARGNLAEALTLCFETADVEEVGQRLRGEVFATHVEVAVGKAAGPVGPGGLPIPRVLRLLGSTAARQPHCNAKGRRRRHGHRSGAGPQEIADRHAEVDYPATRRASFGIRMKPVLISRALVWI